MKYRGDLEDNVRKYHEATRAFMESSKRIHNKQNMNFVILLN